MTADTEAELAVLLDLDYGSFDDDIDFYRNLARRCDGPFLELGAGTGRVALMLAREGHEVWGIDTSAAALESARCKAGELRLTLIESDMRDFDLGRTFELVYAAFGTFHHLITPADQSACLERVRRHLAPGGLLAFDLRPLLEADWEQGDASPLLHDWTRVLPGTGETVTKSRAVRADRATQVQHEWHFYDIAAPDGALRRHAREVDLRFSTAPEVDALLREAGLELDQRYGDYDLSPYEDGSPYMISIARNRGATA